MNANPLVLDIETVPLDAALNMEYPRDQRSHPSNYKDPEKIEAWYLRDEAEWRQARVKECSLNPRLGRVLCIGMSSDDGKDAAVNFAQTEADEPRLLRLFWEQIASEGGEVVTWNGGWDLRFLVIRSLVHRIAPTVRPETVRGWFKRYTTYPHFDCRAVLTNWQEYREGEGLAEWSQFFGVAEKATGMSGADVYPLYQKSDWLSIETYCAQDVMATKAIYEQLASMFDTASRVA